MKITYLLVLQYFREAFGGIFDGIMLEITSLGGQIWTFLLLAFVYWCMDKRAGVYMAGNVGLSCTYSQYFKWLFRVDRPWIRDPRVIPVEKALADAGGYSFPSGHTVRATATWGAMAYYFRKSNKALCRIGCLIVFLVAFSRNYLGVHTSWDILGAFALTFFSMWLMEKALSWSEHGKNRDIVLGIAGCILCFLPMLQAGCLSNAGAAFGMWFGWIAEKRVIHFESCKSSAERLVRFSIGAFGIVFVQTVFSAALKLWIAPKYANFFTMFVLMLFIMAIYPFFFSRRNRQRTGVLGILAALVLTGSLAVIKTGAKTTEENPGQPVTPDTVQAPYEAPKENMVAENDYMELPLIIAHRGYSSHFPENTLASFLGAVDIGADMIELDVQLSKDGSVVVYHDNDLTRIGIQGSVSDYNLEQLQAMDVGGAFHTEYAGEKMPTLAEVLESIKETELDIYVELKDIGNVSGFEEAVLACTESYQMTERCIFASFNSQYLKHLKELNQSLNILQIAAEYDAVVARELRPEYWGLHQQHLTQDIIDTIHEAGNRVFVWTVDDPKEIIQFRDLGVDGIVTNCPGVTKICARPQYSFLAEHYARSFVMPGLYGNILPEQCADAVVQGMTYADGYIIISAYRKSGLNSLLYVLDPSGKWITTVDAGFSAHMGGLAYDDVHGLLWTTGASGSVCAWDWQQFLTCIESEKEDILTAPEPIISFDAELVNHNGTKVASFLDIANGTLYVGSYTIGCNGILRGYDISVPSEPILVTEQNLPEKIQGMAMISGAERKYLLLSQSAQTDDSTLLIYPYNEQAAEYTEAIQSYTLPEGAEQIEPYNNRLMILFESASRPYEETAGLRNDHIYTVDMQKYIWE